MVERGEDFGQPTFALADQLCNSGDATKRVRNRKPRKLSPWVRMNG